MFRALPSSLSELPCGAGMTPALGWVEDRGTVSGILPPVLLVGQRNDLSPIWGDPLTLLAAQTAGSVSWDVKVSRK